MWVHSASIVVQARPQAVWDLYARGAWQHWDDGIESTRLDGPFIPGSVGYVKPRGGKEFRFRITEATPPQLFTAMTRMTGASYEARHELEARGDGCKVTHTAILMGPMAHFYGATLGRRIKRELPLSMAKLAQLAEKEARAAPGRADGPAQRRGKRPARGAAETARSAVKKTTL